MFDDIGRVHLLEYFSFSHGLHKSGITFFFILLSIFAMSTILITQMVPFFLSFALWTTPKEPDPNLPRIQQSFKLIQIMICILIILTLLVNRNISYYRLFARQLYKKMTKSEQISGQNKEEKVKKRRYVRKKKRFFIPKQKKDTIAEEERKLIDAKICPICSLNNRDQYFIMCDQCNDAYHWDCLKMEEPPKVHPWRCQSCLQIPLEESEEIVPEKCFKCSSEMEIVETVIVEEITTKRKSELEVFQSSQRQCQFCKNWFHRFCFRIVGVTCQICHDSLLKMVPKSHVSFRQFIESQWKKVKESEHILVQNLTEIQNQLETLPDLKLKIVPDQSNFERIIRNEASLFYALKAKRLTYCSEQIYLSPETAELNNAKKEIITIKKLHPRDEKTFEQFKKKQKNLLIGPYEIRQEEKKGFFVIATDYIETGSIICEYAGEVLTCSESKGKKKNDSIFQLLMANQSRHSLDICPDRYGNIGRFINGINNSNKTHKHLENVRSIRFSYKGRLRLLLVAKRQINPWQVLYLDYNKGLYHEYPTDDFVQ